MSGWTPGWAPSGSCLRPMLQTDIVGVIEVENSVYPFPWTAGNFADSLAAGHEAWLLERDGELIAYAMLMRVLDEEHLLNLAVASAWQGVGLGGRLLAWLCERATGRGSQAMFLEVRPSNDRARALYVRSGFRQVGVRRRYYPSWDQSREDAIVMRRELPAPVHAAACTDREAGR
jgi:ribosomal-protein-alanine N-acetyltransferase